MCKIYSELMYEARALIPRGLCPEVPYQSAIVFGLVRIPQLSVSNRRDAGHLLQAIPVS